MFYFILLLYFFFHIYLGYRIFRFQHVFSKGRLWFLIPAYLILAIGCVLPLLSLFLPDTLSLYRPVKVLGSYWIACGAIFILYTLIVQLIFGIIKIRKKKEAAPKQRIWASILILLLTLTTFAFGYRNAVTLTTTNYDITLPKKESTLSNLTVMVVADTHFGYHSGLTLAKKIHEKAEELKPDLVLFAGDIFDNAFDGIKNPEEVSKELSKISSRYGSFAVFGNHDVNEHLFIGMHDKTGGEEPTQYAYSDDPASDYGFSKNDSAYRKFLEDAKITILEDEGVLISDQFFLYGRKDVSRTRIFSETRKSPEEIKEELTTSLPVILMDHNPSEHKKCAASGADLLISGHTHGGQFFPINVIVSMMYDNSYGMNSMDSSVSVVTSGAGFFGPPFRLFTKSEVVLLHINFQ